MSYSLATSIRCREVDDGLVLWDAAVNRFIDLNEAAAELWAVMCARSWLPQAAVDHLSSEYGIESEQAAQIVDRFVQDLLSNGALVDVSS